MKTAMEKIINETCWHLTNSLDRSNIFTRIELEKATTDVEKVRLEAIIKTRNEAIKAIREAFEVKAEQAEF